MNIKNFFAGRAVVLVIILVLIGLVAGFYALNNFIYKEKQGDPLDQPQMAANHKDAEYMISGAPVKLVAGVAETESAPGSVSKTTTRYFGNELATDLNDDGRADIVFLLTQETGGSGIFYYVVAALNTDQGYVGSEALFLGDRIAPQTTEKGKGKIVVVNYADRAAGESFTVAPTLAKSLWLILDPVALQFGEVQKDFEGEADPAKMSLGMKTWTWVSAVTKDGKEITAKRSGAFTIKFEADGRVSMTTDCNSMGAKYQAGVSRSLSFTDMVGTLMYCNDSQESEFSSLLGQVKNYNFTSKGELVLGLGSGVGQIVFR